MSDNTTQVVQEFGVGAFPRRFLNWLRSLSFLQRQEEWDSAHAGDIDRGGLKPDENAPDFSLPRVGGGKYSLSDCRGQRVLLVFVQAGCQLCRDIAPELNRLQRSRKVRVLVINRARPHEAGLWADEMLAAFPVLVQSGPDVSKEYEVHATPFAFLIDEQGRIASSGSVRQLRHVDFILNAAARRKSERQPTAADGLPRLPRAGWRSKLQRREQRSPSCVRHTN